MNASRFGKRYMFLAFEIWLQSYIRPLMQTISLLALMEFAGEVLIYCSSSKDLTPIRFASPRSDLFRHYTYQPAQPSNFSLLCFLLCYISRIILFVDLIMSQQGPYRSSHFVG